VQHAKLCSIAQPSELIVSFFLPIGFLEQSREISHLLVGEGDHQCIKLTTETTVIFIFGTARLDGDLYALQERWWQ